MLSQVVPKITSHLLSSSRPAERRLSSHIIASGCVSVVAFTHSHEVWALSLHPWP